MHGKAISLAHNDPQVRTDVPHLSSQQCTLSARCFRHACSYAIWLPPRIVTIQDLQTQEVHRGWIFQCFFMNATGQTAPAYLKVILRRLLRHGPAGQKLVRLAHHDPQVQTCIVTLEFSGVRHPCQSLFHCCARIKVTLRRIAAASRPCMAKASSSRTP